MANHTVEEYRLLDDPKYRAYVSAVDKTLRYFESTSEWADLISALGKLNKVLLSHLKQPVIPRRIVISKRLAQCMHPALPGGVHLKALETYDIIFKCIGTKRLSQELFIYSAGLFPLLPYAATNVRLFLLKLYEDHFMPLGEKLRPGLPGFLNGVLPGLEEGAENYERTNLLLEQVSIGVGREYFFGCLWECVLANTITRLPAITYVFNHFNRKLSTEDQLYIVGTNLDIMVQALCSAVQDQSVLVQRSTLDFIQVAFQMHSTHLIHSDMERLLTSSVSVVLRRDMSLNRRLYSWILGSECSPSASAPSTETSNVGLAPPKRSDSIASDSESGVHYFITYSKDILVQALCSCLKNNDVLAIGDHICPQLRPYRLLISLLDKPEIGSVVLDDILLEVFRALYWEFNFIPGKQCIGLTEKQGDKGQGELLKTANLLFGTLEPHYIWEYLGHHFLETSERLTTGGSRVVKSQQPNSPYDNVQHVGSGSPHIMELCMLTDFLLDLVSVETFIEMQTEHLPKLLRHLTTILSSCCSTLSIAEVIRCLKLCSRLLSKIQPVIIPPASDGNNSPCPSEASSHVLKDAGCKSPLDQPTMNLPHLFNSTLNVPDFGDMERRFSEDLLLPPPSTASFGITEKTPPSKSQTLLRSCVTAFQDCFVKLMTSHLFGAGLDSQGLLQRLLVIQKESEKERQEKLERWLWKVLQGNAPPACSGGLEELRSSGQSSPWDFKDVTLPLLDGAVGFLEAFTLACQILVEFSSFPACFVAGIQKLEVAVSQNTEDSHIPEWLRLLLVTSCFVRQMEFQLVSIGTVLELMALTQSVASAASELSAPEKVHGTFSVLIDPILEASHLQFLHQHTVFCKIIACILWKYLDESHTSCLRKCVELLHQLHNLAPDSSVVEDVIGESMAQDDEKMQVKSVQKFAVLWHLTRGLPPRYSPTGKVRLLDRSLLVMLNCLLKPYGPQRAEVSSWLNHSLQRGDVGAILEPILIILLHPDTARVSVTHVNIQAPADRDDREAVAAAAAEDKNVNEKESKVFAISSVEGRVIYHVSSKKQLSLAMDLQPMSPSATSRRVFAMTSIAGTDTSQVITANSPLRDFDLPSSLERTVNEPISVCVNPFTVSSFSSPEGHQSCMVAPLPNAVACVDQAHRIDMAALRSSCSFDDFENVSVKSSSSSGGVIPASSPEEPQPREIVASLLDELLDIVTGEAGSSSGDDGEEDLRPKPWKKQATEALASFSDSQSSWEGLQDVSVHPLHTYLLLYSQCYDSGRVLYSLSTLKAILQANPRLAVCSMATTSIGNSRSPRQSYLYGLLARHRKAVFGKSFTGELSNDSVTAFRSSMFLEIVISLCLYYTRSYYPNLSHMRISEDDLANNWEVQLLSIDVLTILLAEVASVVRDSAKGFASYIASMLDKCKVQKTILHCVLSGVFLLDQQRNGGAETFTEAIIRFNETMRFGEKRQDGAAEAEEKSRCWDYQETFQIGMLRLLLVLVILEDQLANHKTDADMQAESGAFNSTADKSSTTSALRYQPGVLIPCQPIFLTAVSTALKQPYTSLLHRHWLGLISCALPFLRKATSTIVVTAVSQLCHNLEGLSTLYDNRPRSSSLFNMTNVPPLSQSKGRKVPVDHVILHLEGLTTLCHYCLLDNSSLVSTVSGHPMGSMTGTAMMSGPNATQMISNLINVFVPSAIQKELGKGGEASQRADPLTVARHNVLGKLPRLVSSLTSLWQAVSYSETLGPLQAAWVMGTPKVIKDLILGLLSPLSHHHGINFLATIAIVWNEKKKTQIRQVLPVWSDEQLVLVELIRAIKVIKVHMLVQLVRQVLKQPPIISNKTKNKFPFEVTLLQFFYAYVQAIPAPQLIEAWSSLYSLIKDGMQLTNLNPPALFILLGILNEFVQRSPVLEDRKDQKDLQDLTQKLVEACGAVAAASLEQTTWLRRNVAVKPGPQAQLEEIDSGLSDERLSASSSPRLSTKSDSSMKMSSMSNGFITATANYSVQSLSLLAELLSSLLDVVYLSDEKEKAIPLLTNLMYNVTPYLRNHHLHNVPSFRACSQLLADLSGYPYTRKAWRKDVFDLLLDAPFFQMDAGCLRSWRTIIDNLMTHDKTTFTDLMARVSITQSGGLNLFSSKEQEYEQRAQLLKRLAFVIFCSEIDQYQSAMPDIQERLAECMRLPQVPSVQTQVFLCFRVLLLRMSPQHITSLWPIIITEMVQVFLQIEQELCRDTEEFRNHLRRLSTLESSWVVSASNGLNAHSHPAWLQLYLAVCKLLDLALCLPADRLPQFQMYSWAFVGRPKWDASTDKESMNEENSKLFDSDFVPHVVRLANHMISKDPKCERLPHRSGRPLLTMRQISALSDLQAFFLTVSNLSSMTKHQQQHPNPVQSRATVEPAAAIQQLLELDFLEPLPPVPN